MFLGLSLCTYLLNESDPLAQKPCYLLRMPRELRDEIHRMVVVKRKPPNSWFDESDMIYTLWPPALAQVNRMARAEVLPIYYGENRFRIEMPNSKNDNDGSWTSFIQGFSNLDPGGLKFIKSIDVMHSEDVWEDLNNFLLGFEMRGDGDGDLRCRIGDENLDWNKAPAVRAAFNSAVKSAADRYHYYADLRRRVPVPKIGKVLFVLAQLCPRAIHYVEVAFDYGH